MSDPEESGSEHESTLTMGSAAGHVNIPPAFMDMCDAADLPVWTPPASPPPVVNRKQGALGLGSVQGPVCKEQAAIFIWWNEEWCTLMPLGELATLCGGTESK